MLLEEHALAGVGNGDEAGHLVQSGGVVDLQAGAAPHTRFSGDDYHSVGRFGAVYGRRGTILQHLNGGNVVGVEVVDVFQLLSVYYVKGIRAGGERARTTYPNVGTRTGAAVGRDLHPGQPALDRVERIHRSGLCDGLLVNGGDCPQHIPPALGTVTDDHDLIELCGVIHQHDVDGALGSDGGGGGFESDIGIEQHALLILYREGVPTVDVGQRSVVGSLFLNGHPDEGFSRAIRNSSGNQLRRIQHRLRIFQYPPQRPGARRL